MAREKFVRKHVTKEDAKELFKKIEASRPTSPCAAEKAAITKYEEIAEKLEKKTNKSE